jgi:hypothetical protein
VTALTHSQPQHNLHFRVFQNKYDNTMSSLSSSKVSGTTLTFPCSEVPILIFKYDAWSSHVSTGSAGERGVAGANYGGLGPGYAAHVLVSLGSNLTCRLHKLTLSRQTQVTLQLTASISDLACIQLAGPPLLGGLNPPSAAVCTPPYWHVQN